MPAEPWRSDTEFVSVLLKREYLAKDGGALLSAGLYLYLHELFLDGAKQGLSMLSVSLEDWKIVIAHWRNQGRDLKYLGVPAELADQLGVPLSDTAATTTHRDEEDDMTEPATKTSTARVWNKRKKFDGKTCGIRDCTRSAKGYMPGVRSTAEGKNGRPWWGPGCKQCAAEQNIPLLLIRELFEQQGKDVSGLSILLDLEVGEVMRRLEAPDGGMIGRPVGLQVFQDALEGIETPETLATEAQRPSSQIAPAADADDIALAFGDKMETYTISVALPLSTIESINAEVASTTTALTGFLVRSQAQMDYTSSYVQRVKALYNDLEEKRKAISLPFRKQVEKIQKGCKPALDGLLQLEKQLKALVEEGMVWAASQQQQAFQQAEQALAVGNLPQAALATQQAVQADITLSQGVSTRTYIKFEIVDPSVLPAECWSPDRAKVQAYIDAGYRFIPGVNMWEESSLAVSQPR